MLPSLEGLGVRIHSDIRYQDGHEDCPGELRVIEIFGSKDEWVELECKKCLATMALVNKVQPDLSWQQRKDLA